jgi:hypothetical protein
MEQENELDLLIDALCEGQLDEPGMARLEQLVADDPKARRRMVMALQLDGHLRWEYGAGIQAEEPASVDPSPAPKPLPMGQPSRGWMAVAAGLILLIGGGLVLRGLDFSAPPSVDLVAIEAKMVDPSGEVRERAVVEFARHAGAEQAEKMVRVLKEDDNRYVRAAAARGLGWMGATAQKPALYDALRDEAIVVRKAAISAIDRLTDAWNAVAADAVQLVRVYREDQNNEVRAAAARGLGGIGAYKQKQVLFEALDDRSLAVRHAAVDAINQIAGIRIRLAGATESDRRAAIAVLKHHWPAVERYYERRLAAAG